MRRANGSVLIHDVLWQGTGEQRRLLAPLAPVLKGEKNGMGMRRRPLQHQHFEDGGVEFVGAVAREEAVQAGDGAVQGVSALDGAGEELGAGRDGVGQAVGEARSFRPALVLA